MELGRKIYNFRCYFCHGYSGDAKTVAAQQLDPPPRDFTRARNLTPGKAAAAIEKGVAGTGMKSFANVLSAEERAAVAAFVVDEFVARGARNTAYHTAENGWPDHQGRYAAAFPFVKGEIGVETPVAQLTPDQAGGRQLYLGACITCHEPRAGKSRATLEAYPLSHMGEVVRDVDAVSRASVYGKHDKAPEIPGLTGLEARGKGIYDQNCAFCHAADGTGRNWIGAFLQPHPRNFTDPAESKHLDPDHVRLAVREGLPNTSMPAWASVLGKEDIEAVVAYVERAFLRAMRAQARSFPPPAGTGMDRASSDAPPTGSSPAARP